VFIAVTAGLPATEQRKIVIKTIVIAAAILLFL
jgi:small neutral amino acid transporter SnatA (MarC family)